MTQSALVRIRKARSQEPILRLLAFQLRHHWFCLPLAIARRVLQRELTPAGPAMDLIQLRQENIPVLDIARLVYGKDKPQLAQSGETNPPATAPEDANLSVQNIVVIDLSRGDPVGLLVDGVPTLKRVRQSAFSPVPPIYVTTHQLRGLSSVIQPDPQMPDSLTQPMFLLNVEALLQ
ncbi:MAG: chemotaxis protein CheW [Cyanobacteria bacterium P01_H01_bin.153]